MTFVPRTSTYVSDGHSRESGLPSSTFISCLSTKYTCTERCEVYRLISFSLEEQLCHQCNRRFSSERHLHYVCHPSQRFTICMSRCVYEKIQGREYLPEKRRQAVWQHCSNRNYASGHILLGLQESG